MTDRDRVEQFILAVFDAAIADANDGVPEYDQHNTRERLPERLNLGRFRQSPRRGDGKYARSIYTAARWLYKTEIEQ